MEYYLAIDIGASSGRHILGWIENGKLILRGKIGPFGRNQIWIKNNDLSLKNENLTPIIPEKE